MTNQPVEMPEPRITAPLTAVPMIIATGTETVAAPVPQDESGSIVLKNLSLYYGGQQVLQDVSFPIRHKKVTALIGPSGCGKSSLLRCLNRMNDHLPRCKVVGGVEFDGFNIYAPGVNTNRLRRFVGMVAQKSNPFPKSIYENVAFGIRLHKLARNAEEMNTMVCQALTRVGLWHEIKDRLNQNALALSGGQQQRLCIARTIAVSPKVILMDEPASALDPLATARIEELIRELQADYSIVLVTHNLQQAVRCSDYTAFLYLGKLVEFDDTAAIFCEPRNELTKNYIMGRFG
ncbi:MAG TPA: phosphate ABC transporter ATP-binding protein PstB [Verrucomicrobiae bacterium]